MKNDHLIRVLSRNLEVSPGDYYLWRHRIAQPSPSALASQSLPSDVEAIHAASRQTSWRRLTSRPPSAEFNGVIRQSFCTRDLGRFIPFRTDLERWILIPFEGKEGGGNCKGTERVALGAGAATGDPVEHPVHALAAGNDYPRPGLELNDHPVEAADARLDALVARLSAHAAIHGSLARAAQSEHSHSLHYDLYNIPTRDKMVSGQYRWQNPDPDITDIRTAEDWLYLAGVLVLLSRTLVGWATNEWIDTSTALAAFNMGPNPKPLPSIPIATLPVSYHFRSLK